MESNSVLERSSHPVKLAEYCVELAPKMVRSDCEFTIVTAGELGVRNPPLLSNATRSVNPAFVTVAGAEIGIVKTESMMCINPPR